MDAFSAVAFSVVILYEAASSIASIFEAAFSDAFSAVAFSVVILYEAASSEAAFSDAFMQLPFVQLPFIKLYAYFRNYGRLNVF